MHFSHFYRIPCLFQNFRVLKNSPFKVRLEFPRKIPCFFQNFPIQKTMDITNSVFFQKKFRVLQNSPVFIFFKSLKNTRKKPMYFCIKNIYLQVKSIYLQIIKHLQKTRGSLSIIFTVFRSSKKQHVNIYFLRYFNTLSVSYHFHIVSFLSFPTNFYYICCHFITKLRQGIVWFNL